jgi:hypothetical protein
VLCECFLKKSQKYNRLFAPLLDRIQLSVCSLVTPIVHNELISDEARSLSTEDVKKCCLFRAVAHCKGAVCLSAGTTTNLDEVLVVLPFIAKFYIR